MVGASNFHSSFFEKIKGEPERFRRIFGWPIEGLLLKGALRTWNNIPEPYSRPPNAT
jgi:hypothetical protein